MSLTVAENLAIGAAMVFEIRALLNAEAHGSVGRRLEPEFVSRRDAFIRRRDYFESLFRDAIVAGIRLRRIPRSQRPHRHQNHPRRA